MVLFVALALFIAPVVLTVVLVNVLLDAYRACGMPPFNPTNRAFGA